MAGSETDPTNSSSGKEDDGSSDESSESEPTPIKNPPSSSSKKPSRPITSSSEKDESGSDSDTDSGKPDPNIKPISSKPMEIPNPNPNPPKPVTKPRSKTIPALKSKRPAPVTQIEAAVESKKAKKKGEDIEDGSETAKKANVDDPKKILFQRLWSEDDEVVILKGISEYTLKKKADPIADMNAFHDFIKKSLHVDVSKTQLSDKVRRLKKKYVNNFRKEKNGKERNFSKLHEQLCYNLSKKIWGSNGSGESVKVDNGKSNGTAKRYHIQRNGKVSAPSEVYGDDERKEVTAMEVDRDVQSIEPVLSRGKSGFVIESADQMIKNEWKMVDESKRIEWEKKSKKLLVEEVELYSKRLELMHEQVKLVSEAMSSAQ